MRGLLLALALLLSLLSGGAAAQQRLSSRECREGGDFIRNAALSRDTGTTREFFVGRLEEDLLTIRAVPPSLTKSWVRATPSGSRVLWKSRMAVSVVGRVSGLS